MSELLLSRRKELKAMRRQKIKAAVGLLVGHTTLSAQIFKYLNTAAGIPTVRG
jgi:hypothetical protein